ncbi:hypothetical protein C8R45DRAFT_945459 [Mycena sanguinolenta]|nr:hypothetical protein C8R45DRAFT_945459 [Mycena sanguinolenta]
MRFTSVASILFAAVGLVHAEDYRLLYQIPAGDTMAEFTTAFQSACNNWAPAEAARASGNFLEAYVQPGDYTGANATTEALIYCSWVITYTVDVAAFLEATELFGI